jgi:D-alanyl-D-alanine carboxypeptidase/D-alanyl-D-alanine-endopeptidase (penicillin-binding protein 4)
MRSPSRGGPKCPPRRRLAELKVCAAIAIALTAVSCAHPTNPAAAPNRVAASPTPLQHDIDALLARPELAHGSWGVLVRSLKTNETLYAVNARKLMLPASNMKIVTLAAAAQKLGWSYAYETKIVATGPIVNGTLKGDLVVIGSGDPSLMDASGGGTPPFDAWIAKLKEVGIRRITGRIVGNDEAMEKRRLGFGWSWDDLVEDYAAPIGALQYNENAARVTVTPATLMHQHPTVSVEPDTSGLEVRNLVVTDTAESAPRVAAHRMAGSPMLVMRGSVPAGGKPVSYNVSVDNPKLFFVATLRAALIAGGIDVAGPAADLDDGHDAPVPPDATPIASFHSAPLSTLAVRMMKISQNLYAETLLETMSGTEPATVAGGRAALQAVLAPWGITDADLIVRDGSGLTRYDFVTSETLVTILTHVAGDPNLRGPFDASLPIAGRDGTLANRMKGTAAEGNAHAKTGSMTGVRGISGYVTTADGEPLVFSVLVNNFDTPGSVITQTEDAIVVRLATLRRP